MVDYLVEMDFYKTASCRCKIPTLALTKLSGSVLYKKNQEMVIVIYQKHNKSVFVDQLFYAFIHFISLYSC